MSFDGCWQCENIDGCDTGFFSSGENDAKAYALFIKKYGTEEYTKTVLNLIHKGYNYPKAFKTINNVGKILKIFEENR